MLPRSSLFLTLTLAALVCATETVVAGEALPVTRTAVKVDEKKPVFAGDGIVAYVMPDPDGNGRDRIGWLKIGESEGHEVPGSIESLNSMFGVSKRKVVWIKRTMVKVPGTNNAKSRDVASVFDTETGESADVGADEVWPELGAKRIACGGDLAVVLSTRRPVKSKKAVTVVDVGGKTPKVTAFDAKSGDGYPSMVAVDGANRRVAAVYGDGKKVVLFDVNAPSAEPRSFKLADRGVSDEVEAQLAGDRFMYCEDDGEGKRPAKLLDLKTGEVTLLDATRGRGNIVLTEQKYAYFLYDQERAEYPLIVGDLAKAGPTAPPKVKDELGNGTSVAMTPDGQRVFLAGHLVGRRLQMSVAGGPFAFAPSVTKEFEGITDVAASASVLAFKIVKEHAAKLGYASLAGALPSEHREGSMARPREPAPEGARPVVALKAQRTAIKLPEKGALVAAGDGIVAFGTRRLYDLLGVQFVRTRTYDGKSQQGETFQDCEYGWSDYFCVCGKKIVFAKRVETYDPASEQEDAVNVMCVYDTASGGTASIERRIVSPNLAMKKIHADGRLAVTISKRSETRDRKPIKLIDVAGAEPVVTSFDLEGAGDPSQVAVDAARKRIVALFGSTIAVFDIANPTAPPRTLALPAGASRAQDDPIALLSVDDERLKPFGPLAVGEDTSLALLEGWKVLFRAGKRPKGAALEASTGGPFAALAAGAKEGESIVDVAAGQSLVAFKYAEEEERTLGFAVVGEGHP